MIICAKTLIYLENKKISYLKCGLKLRRCLDAFIDPYGDGYKFDDKLLFFLHCPQLILKITRSQLYASAHKPQGLMPKSTYHRIENFFFIFTSKFNLFQVHHSALKNLKKNIYRSLLRNFGAAENYHFQQVLVL